MKATLKYDDGSKVDLPTIQDAMQEVIALYPDGVAVDAGGREVDETTPDERYDVRSGRAALIWANPDEAGEPGTGDDGANAVAEITVRGE